MPVTVKEIITGARMYLRFPDPGRLSNAVLLFTLYDKMDWIRGELNITAQDWLLERWSLTVVPNKDEYLVTAPVGGGLSVGRWVDCFTDDPTGNPQFCRREVEIATIQDMDTFYIGPRVQYAPTTDPWVATSFSFFNEGGGLKCKVTPQHATPANYLFFYEPDRPTPPALNQNYPLLQGFVNLVKVDLALACLDTLANKDENGNVLNQSYINLMQGILQPQFDRYNDLFQQYKQQVITDQSGPRVGFACDEPLYEDWFF